MVRGRIIAPSHFFFFLRKKPMQPKKAIFSGTKIYLFAGMICGIEKTYTKAPYTREYNNRVT